MSDSAKSATPTISLKRRESADPATSDLHDDRQHERAQPRSLPEEPLQSDAEPFLDQARIGALFDAGALQSRREQRRDLLQQCLRARVDDEPARDHVGGFLEGPRLLADRHHRNHETVAGKMTPVPKHFVTNFAAAGAVNQDPAGGDPLHDPPAGLVETDEVAALGEYNLCGRRDPRRHAGMAGELAVLTVYRHEEPGPDQRKHELELFFAAVSGH